MPDNKRNPKENYISICICTFKRPEFLENALDEVITQVTNGQFSFEIIVVDNDKRHSAESVVKKYQKDANLNIIYDCEPEQNIALTRNRAVRSAGGNFIAFIDDDEKPVKDWLYSLFHTLKTTGADGVLGPVLPFYPEEAPKWLSECKLFDRRRFRTGTVLTNTRDTRTGNVLFPQSLFQDGIIWFNPAFGRTGGEDVDFFVRQMAKGKTFVWCDEAVAYETIPPERWKAGFYIKRYLRGGMIASERVSKKKMMSLIIFIKSLVAIPVWLFIFFCSLPFGKSIWFRPILKMSYFGGFVLSSCGLSFLRERE